MLAHFFKDQYSAFNATLISNWSISKQSIRQYDANIKAIHKRQLSLACIATIISKQTQRSEYAEGIVETSHLAMVLAIKGLENSAFVLLRQTIELTLKHIFFSTHPTEYKWASTRIDYKELTFQRLIEFIKKTDEYQVFSQNHKMCDVVEKLYGELSRYVHVHNSNFIGYSKTGLKYKTDKTIIDKLDRNTKVLWPVLIVLLVIFFPKKYNHASAIEKKLIRNALPKTLKLSLDTYIRNYISI
jgi:hypothetical protein